MAAVVVVGATVVAVVLEVDAVAVAEVVGESAARTSGRARPDEQAVATSRPAQTAAVNRGTTTSVPPTQAGGQRERRDDRNCSVTAPTVSWSPERNGTGIAGCIAVPFRSVPLLLVSTTHARSS